MFEFSLPKYSSILSKENCNTNLIVIVYFSKIKQNVFKKFLYLDGPKAKLWESTKKFNEMSARMSQNK